MFLFAQRLQDAAAPAISLLDDVEQHLRRLGVRDRFRLVMDLPAVGQDLHRHVEVLGEGVAVIAAGGLQGGAAEDADRSGDDVDRPPKRLRIADDVEALDVFERLQFGPDVVAIDDFDVPRHGADGLVREVANGVPQRVGREARVAVHADHDRRIGAADAVIERVRLAAVLLAIDRDLDAVMIALELFHLHVRGVGRAVVDGDDLVIRIAQLEQRGQRGANDALLVVRRHDDREEGIRFARLLRGKLALMQIAEPDHHEMPQKEQQKE